MLGLLHSLRGDFLAVAVHIAIGVVLVSSAVVLHAQGKQAQRLIDRLPFDRITLDTGDVIDVQLLDLPDRRTFNTIPPQGKLKLRRLSDPSVLYELQWAEIKSVDLFEQLLLKEVFRFIKAKQLIEAYEYLDFLHRNYPKLSGLQRATEAYLRQDALAAYSDKKYDESLSILLSLYDLNPEYSGLSRFVEGVTDRLISTSLAERDFAAARNVLDLLEQGFPELKLGNISEWQTKFSRGAAAQLAAGRQAMDEQKYMEARQAVQRALDILPAAQGAVELLAEIDRRSPQMVVGVNHLGGADSQVAELGWTASRVASLTDPQLIEIVDFGAEGGKYRTPWGEIKNSASGEQLTVAFSNAALKQGLTPARTALQVLRQTDPAAKRYQANLAGLLKSVDIRNGHEAVVHWRHAHVRPEALLQLPLNSIVGNPSKLGAYQRDVNEEVPNYVTYNRPTTGGIAPGPRTIIEQYFENEEAALIALRRGAVDVLAKIPPWQIERFQQLGGVTVASYRLPTIHVLLPNYAKPLMGRREFRRAICYGIDRPQILDDILLGGESRRGYKVLSGPLPAGNSLSDPVGYAYQQALQPRPYEPRLAAVLSTVARKSLAKYATAKSKPYDSTEEKKKDAPPPEPLVLAYPPTPVARIACQTIKLQLDAVGIPLKLKELPPFAEQVDEGFDLLYTELLLSEPLVDARRLLGPKGLAGYCSPSMSLALEDVDSAQNWKDARDRLREVHQVAFNDLPVIPLWQIVDFYAYRNSLNGIGKQPVTLYQNIANWKNLLAGAGSR